MLIALPLPLPPVELDPIAAPKQLAIPGRAGIIGLQVAGDALPGDPRAAVGVESLADRRRRRWVYRRLGLGIRGYARGGVFLLTCARVLYAAGG